MYPFLEQEIHIGPGRFLEADPCITFFRLYESIKNNYFFWASNLRPKIFWSKTGIFLFLNFVKSRYFSMISSGTDIVHLTGPEYLFRFGNGLGFGFGMGPDTSSWFW